MPASRGWLSAQRGHFRDGREERDRSTVHDQQENVVLLGKMVPEEGVEPTHSCLYGILSPARLPVPPLRPELGIIPRSGPGSGRDDAQLRKVVAVAPWIAGEQRVTGDGGVRADVEVWKG